MNKISSNHIDYCLLISVQIVFAWKTDWITAKKPPKPKPFFKLIRNLLKFQFFLVIIYITVKKFLNHLILYFKISSISSILRLIESDMDLVIPKTMECMDWWHTFFFDFPIVFRVFNIFFYSFYLIINLKEEMCVKMIDKMFPTLVIYGP